MITRTIKVATPLAGEDEVEAIRAVVLSGNYVSGAKVEAFERAFAGYMGMQHAVAVNSGTAALHVALASLGIGPGDEVIVPPLTFISTITAVLHQNATPIFADVDPETFCMLASDVESRITPRTKAIIPVHLYGNAADMQALSATATRHGLRIIEDCAQAHGTTFNGTKVGALGDIGAFSFFATKHITTGEGGMIVTDDEGWAAHARLVRSHGLVNRDDHVCLGYNYRMTEMAAAMGLVQLPKLDHYNDRRISNSRYLLNALAARPQWWFSLTSLDGRVGHTFFWCPVVINVAGGFETKDVVARLKDRGVEVRQRYQAPLYRQQVLLDYKFTHPPSQRYSDLYLPNAEKIAGHVIGLPNHPGLTRDDLDYVADVVATLY